MVCYAVLMRAKTMIHIILIAFLFVESVKSTSTLCACTDSDTNVYLNQTINSRITRLSPGDCVTVLNKDTEWLKVSLTNIVGYVASTEVMKKQCSIEQTETGQNVKRFLESLDRTNICLQEHCLKCVCHSGGTHCGDCHDCHRLSGSICSQWQSKVDGAWSEWSSWQYCSTTCGGGYQIRIRNCDNPPKATIFGKDCEGDRQQQQTCNTQHCPIDGGWTPWSIYSPCTKTCGTGSKSRTRTCSSPPPQYNGKVCSGASLETATCNTNHCPVDGGWSAFSAYSPCTKTCGGGTMFRQRTCTNPSPEYGGALCIGFASETTQCNAQNCPIDGNWGEWTQWTNCDVSCAGGRRSRQRACTNPKPMYGGIDCSGDAHQEEKCATYPCPIDGGWGSWGPYSPCSAVCGSQSNGFRYAQRYCTNPAPQYNGRDCTGDKYKYIPCSPTCSSSTVLHTHNPVTHIVTTTITSTSTTMSTVTNAPTSTASPTTSNINNQQASSLKTCDKIGVVRVLGNNLKVTHSLASQCPDNTYATPEALLLEFCSMSRTSTWHKGMKVTDACANHVLTTSFVPVASYQGSVLSKYSGIFMGCASGGFKIAMQLCGHPAGIFHIYNSSSINGILDPSNYYIVT